MALQAAHLGIDGRLHGHGGTHGDGAQKQE
jgi:hypothetical protein